MAAPGLVRIPYQPRLPALDEPLPQGWTRQLNEANQVVYVSLNPDWAGEGSQGQPTTKRPTKSAWDHAKHPDSWVLPEGWTQAPDKETQDRVKNTIVDVQKALRPCVNGSNQRRRVRVDPANLRELHDITDHISPDDRKKGELKKEAERLENEVNRLGKEENSDPGEIKQLIEDYTKFQNNLLPHTCDFVNQKSGEKQKKRPTKEARVEDLRQRIQSERNRLHETGTARFFFDEILVKMAHHGAHTIYAPDEAAIQFSRGVYSAYTSIFAYEDEDEENAKQTCVQRLQSFLGMAKVKVTIIMIVLAMVLLKIGETWQPGNLDKPLTSWLSSQLQQALSGWMTYNQSLNWFTLYLSICCLMCMRMFVSNILPFTSPVFAIFITKSMPDHMKWAAAIYLLACSAPAGLVIPFFDWLLYKYNKGGVRSTKQDKINQEFQFTTLASKFTDYLPFSFWVRTCLMEPVYAVVEAVPGNTEANCACAAVLAGHFMIWAGPATTMYQRNYVPDVITCFFIQPLGLLEDVAVVLATWASHSAASGVDAQIAMYLFMACMNLIDFLTGKRSTKLLLEHLMVLFCTVVAAYQWYRNTACLMPGHPEFVFIACPLSSQTSAAATSTSQADSEASIHTAIGISAQVTCVALWGRLMSRLIVGGFSSLLFDDKDDEKALDEPLLP